jgi:hypothetical protein
VRRPQPQFVTHKSPTPNGKRYWYIIGRPHGERVRAWFDSEEQARKEAERRNQEMRKESSPGNITTKSDDIPGSVTTKSDDELSHLRKENNNLRLENDKLRAENSDLREYKRNAQEIFKEKEVEPISFDDQDKW